MSAPEPARSTPQQGSPPEWDAALPAWARAFAAERGAVSGVFAAFLTQDSGCRGFGLEVGDARWFLKLSEEPRGVASLGRAAALHARVQHPAIVPVREARIEDARAALLLPWVAGESLYDPAVHARLRAQPLPAAERAFAAVLSAHETLAAAGYVSCDLCDGCFLLEPTADRDDAAGSTWLIDLDEYRAGPFRVEGERLPGSRRFMAPEEWTHGAWIDERTTVFHLARAAAVLLGADREGDLARWRGTPAQAAAVRRGQEPDPARRWASVAAFAAAWRAT